MTLVALEPVMVIAFGFVLFGSRITKLQSAGMLLAIVGTLLIGLGGVSLSPDSEPKPYRLIGNVVTFGAVVLYGVYFAANKALKAEKKSVPDHEDKSWDFCLAGFVFGVAAIVGGVGVVAQYFWMGSIESHLSVKTLTALFALGLIPTLIGHTLIQMAARTVSPVWVALASPGETLGAVLIGFFAFGSAPTFLEMMGGVAVIAGAVIVGVNLKASGR